MTEYALNLARQAKTFVPPMTDEEIVQTVSEHFDVEIARELRPSVVRNISQMISMLDTLENERETQGYGSRHGDLMTSQRRHDTTMVKKGQLEGKKRIGKGKATIPLDGTR